MTVELPDFARSCLERLGSPAFEWYRYDEELPGPRDREVLQAVEAYLSASSAQREAAAVAVDPWSGHSLVSFAERACSWALRTGDARMLRRAAAAVAWQWLGCEDPCDGIAVLGAVYDATHRLRVPAQEVFAFAATYAPAAIAPAFSDFLLRPDLNDIAAVMGYSVTESGGDAHYVRSW